MAGALQVVSPAAIHRPLLACPLLKVDCYFIKLKIWLSGRTVDSSLTHYPVSLKKKKRRTFGHLVCKYKFEERKKNPGGGKWIVKWVGKDKPHTSCVLLSLYLSLLPTTPHSCTTPESSVYKYKSQTSGPCIIAIFNDFFFSFDDRGFLFAASKICTGLYWRICSDYFFFFSFFPHDNNKKKKFHSSPQISASFLESMNEPPAFL